MLINERRRIQKAIRVFSIYKNHYKTYVSQEDHDKAIGTAFKYLNIEAARQGGANIKNDKNNRPTANWVEDNSIMAQRVMKTTGAKKIYECSKCGGSKDYTPPFCEWCGAKMLNYNTIE